MRMLGKVSKQVFETGRIDSSARLRICGDIILLLGFGDTFFLDFEAWRSYPGDDWRFRGGVTTARKGR